MISWAVSEGLRIAGQLDLFEASGLSTFEAHVSARRGGGPRRTSCADAHLTVNNTDSIPDPQQQLE